MNNTEFEEYFDNGGSVMPYADMTQAQRPNKTKRVNVDFPLWMVAALDAEARHLGVTRQSLVKVWIAQCLSQQRGPNATVPPTLK